MAYIGQSPSIGNFQVCDAISVVNGQAAYTMQVSSVNVVPETANHMLVSLNGILQRPGSSFTVAGSTITFASNLVTGDVINFIHILGSVLDLGVPSDSTVSLAKLTATGTKNSTTFLRGDNTFAAAGGGKLLQVVQATTTTTNTINSSGFQATSITANITPASSSNKVLVFASSTMYADTNTAQATATIYRGSTNLASTKFAENYNSAGKIITPFCMQFLDSPNTTSQTTYTVYGTTNSGNAVFNGPGDTTGVITLMEIEG